MARPENKNSKRQRGFRILNQMHRARRSVAIKRLETELNIGKAYAETLFAAHKKIGKEQGLYVTTYRIIDVNNGQRVDPYISTKEVRRPKAADFLTAEDAIANYVDKQVSAIATANSLI